MQIRSALTFYNTPDSRMHATLPQTLRLFMTHTGQQPDSTMLAVFLGAWPINLPWIWYMLESLEEHCPNSAFLTFVVWRL